VTCLSMLGNVMMRATVNERNPRASLSATLFPARALSGRILGPEGQPARLARVDIINLSTESPARKIIQTDDRGEFHVTGLIPGQHVIAAELLAAPRTGQNTVVRTYYPGTMDSSRAAPVTIGLGSDVRNIDFQIQSTSTVSIFGKMTFDLSGVTLPANVRVSPTVSAIANISDPANPRPSHGGPVNPETGEFEIRGVPPGSYTVIGRIQAPGVLLAGLASIDVGYQDVRGVQLLVRRGIDVSLKIVGGSNPRSVTRTLTLTPRRAGISSTAVGAGDSQNFVLSNVFPGTYDISTFTYANECIRDLLQGGRSILESGVTIGANSGDPITLVLESPRQLPARLQGQRLVRCPAP
jgi:hypothetical protein